MPGTSLRPDGAAGSSPSLENTIEPTGVSPRESSSMRSVTPGGREPFVGANPIMRVLGNAEKRASARARSAPWMRSPVTGRQAALASNAPAAAKMKSAFSIALTSEIVDLRVHVVGGLHDFRVGFVGTLAADQVDEFVNDADVRLFDVTLQDGPEAVGSAGRPDNSCAGCIGRRVEALPEGIESRGILEVGESDLAAGLRGRLTGEIVTDSAVRGNVDGLRSRRNRDLRLQQITVRSDDVAGGIQMERTGSR